MGMKMVDRHRERRVLSEDSEEFSEGSDKEQQASNGSDSESGVEKPTGGELDYESNEQEEAEASEDDAERPTELTEAEDPQTVESTLAELVDDEVGQKHAVDGELIGLEGEESEEGQEGDEESVISVRSKDMVLDDDEDRRNPQYIPKNGSFYEHDDRVNVDPDEKKDVKDKKKLWVDDGKWKHDMFREEEQAPKSREELIAIYGYDIRNSSRARRRRYRRGPSKCTNNWQDEDALAGRLKGSGTDPSLVRESARGRGKGRRSRERFARHSDAMDKTRQDDTIPEETVVVKYNGQPKVDHKDASITNKEGFPALVSLVIDKKVDRGPTKPQFPANKNCVSSVAVESSPTVSSSSTVNVVATPSEVVRTQTFENSKSNSNNHGKPKREDVTSGSASMDTFRSSSMRGGRIKGQKGRSNKANGTGRGRDRGYSMERRGAEQGNWSSGCDKKGGGGAGEDKLSAAMQRLNLKDANNGRQENSHGLIKKESSMNDSKDACLVSHSHQTECPPPSNGGNHVSSSSSSRPKRYSSLRQRSLPEYSPASEYLSNAIDIVDNHCQDDHQFAAMHSDTDAMPAESQQQVFFPSMVPATHFQGYNTSPYQETYEVGLPMMPNPPHSSSYQSSQQAAAASLHTTPYYDTSEYLSNGINVVDNHCQDDYQSAVMYGVTDAMPAETQQQVFSPSMVAATHFQGYNMAPYQEIYAIRPATMPSPSCYYPPVTLAAPHNVMATTYISPNGNIMNYAPTPTGYVQHPPFQQFTPLQAAAPLPPPMDPNMLTL